MNKLYTIYFSATDTTRRCVEKVFLGLGAEPTQEINLADGFDVELPELSADDVVVVGAPVYGGRLPEPVADALKRIKGNETTAIAVVVYGNRDYDDALLEMTDILHDAGCRIVGAGAFIAQHSIFPKVGTSRPDLTDEHILAAFGRECKSAIQNGFNAEEVPYIKGNRPYKKYGGVPFHPKAKESDCVRCGKCVEACPMGAISAQNPFATDESRCISCGRCIFVCSKSARGYSGMAYATVGAGFRAAYSKRKEPEFVVTN